MRRNIGGSHVPRKTAFFFLVCVLKRIIAHLSSHKMPLSLFNGNMNNFCILERRVMLTSSPSPGVFVYKEKTVCVCVCVWLHLCVNRTEIGKGVCAVLLCVCVCRALMLTFKLRVVYFSGVGELCGRRGLMVVMGLGGKKKGGTSVVLECLWVRLQQWGSNRGHEWECLFMWVSGLPFNPFSFFCLCKGSSCSTHGCAWLKDKPCVRGKEVEHTTSETKPFVVPVARC